ncbi:MAG: rod shape-determining protein MreD [Burkholderiaceae bacterium]|jgi:rod shape-determining protein MreD
MIMPRGTGQLLLPANPAFVWGSILLALMGNLLPVGRAWWMPDLLALVVVFWNIHQPRRVGVVAAFIGGVLMDVHQGALLGQHALAYTLLGYASVTLHRRLLWFGLGGQMAHVLPLFLTAQLLSTAIRLFAGGMWPGWGVVAQPLMQTLLWPVATLVLLAPQRRAPDPDENRPL